MMIDITSKAIEITPTIRERIESRFAKLYEVSYLTAHNEEQATNDLKHLANRLGKFYVQSRQKSPNLSSIQQLSSTEYLYMDKDVFKSVYVQILQSSKQK